MTLPTLHGIDVSKFQSPATVAAWLARSDFAIACTSQGRYLAPAHDAQAAQVRAAGKLLGHYTYAEINNNGAHDAGIFLDATRARPGEVVVLDFEPFGQANLAARGPAWVVEAATYTHSRTRAWPWLYSEDFHLSALVADATAAQLAVIRNLPLWKAGNANRYPNTPAGPVGSLHGWSTLTAWQWTDTPLDRDEFYGDRTAWAKLAIPGAPAPAHAPAPRPRPPIRVANLRPGLRNADVRAYCGLLWKAQPAAYKLAHLAAWLREPGAYFGPTTERVTFDTYARLHTAHPALWGPPPAQPAWPGPKLVTALGGLPY